VTRERLEILREADAILQEEIRRAGLYRELWQSLRRAARDPLGRRAGRRAHVRLPDRDPRGHLDDAMTADWARLPYDLLETISARIVNEIPRVNRVVARHHVEAAGDDRVGVTLTARRGLSTCRRRGRCASGPS
jgi:GMP synthase (glutamine-hydrolysing)